MSNIRDIFISSSKDVTRLAGKSLTISLAEDESMILVIGTDEQSGENHLLGERVKINNALFKREYLGRWVYDDDEFENKREEDSVKSNVITNW